MTCDNNVSIEWYDELIVPLLHQMSNLESLGLYLMVRDHYQRDKFIDGDDLKNNVIDHLPRLNKFVFNIYSMTRFNQINFVSNEDIQNTFINFKVNQIISCVNYFNDKKVGRCHIYTLPYTMKYYKHIANNFPGGLFKCVREITLSDIHPFEHEFFIRISQAFPFLKVLSLRNQEPQQNKQSQKSMNETNEEHLIIRYSYLTELDLMDAHDDYVEQFLDGTKTYLPKNIKFRTTYDCLQRVTHNFTREITRINSTKINNLILAHPYTITDKFIMYFPLIKSSSILILRKLKNKIKNQ